MSNHYVYCTSDFSDANSFHINLAESLKLNGDWECALKEISYNSGLYTFIQSTFIFQKLVEIFISVNEVDGKPKLSGSSILNVFEFVVEDKENAYLIVKLEDGYISTHRENERFFKGARINLKIPSNFSCVISKDYTVDKKYFSSIDKLCDFFTNLILEVTFKNDKNHISIDIPKHSALVMSEESCQTLGFKEMTIMNSERAEYPPQLQRNIKNIYVYCDAIDYCYLNNIKAPLLKIIPFEFSLNHNRITHLVNDPYYINISKRELTSIAFHLRTNTGEHFPFLTNSQTIITLHLREKK